MSAEVILGDCLEIMRGMADASVDSVITDPPYGTTALHFDQTPIDWAAWWAEVHRVTKEAGVVVCFAADLFTVDLIQSNRKNYRYRLVWEKSRSTGFLDAGLRPLRSHEDILIFSRRFKSSTYNPQKQAATRFTRSTTRQGNLPDTTHWGDGKGRYAWEDDGTRHPGSVLQFASIRSQDSKHPTQKPLDLMQWLVGTYTNPGDHILDPFAGSGSTGAACVALGRRFTGIELDANYHATAQKRVQNAVPALLGAS